MTRKKRISETGNRVEIACRVPVERLFLFMRFRKSCLPNIWPLHSPFCTHFSQLLIVGRLVTDSGHPVWHSRGHLRTAMPGPCLFQRVRRHNPQRWLGKERINHCRKSLKQRPLSRLISPSSSSFSCLMHFAPRQRMWIGDGCSLFSNLQEHRVVFLQANKKKTFFFN